LQDAIVATDERGQIRYANVAAENLMGWPHGSLVGRSALDLDIVVLTPCRRDGDAAPC
jgi:PAS domain S-box-containing protein